MEQQNTPAFNMPAQQQNAAPQLASVPERLFALIIDYLPFYLLSFGSLWYISISPKFIFMSQKGMYGVFIGWQILFLIYVLIFNTGSLNTLGKWMMGIKAQESAGGNLGILSSLTRTVGYLLGFLTMFITFLPALITKKRTALHDIMAGTIVIRTREKSGAEETFVTFAGATMMAVLVAFAYYSVFKTEPVQQKKFVYNAQQQIYKVVYLQELHKKQYGFYTLDLTRLALISGDPVQFKRDMQQNLRRKDFVMGVSKDSFRVTGIAKDNKKTKVTYP